MLKTEQYFELDEDIVLYFRDIEKDYAFAIDIPFLYQNFREYLAMLSLFELFETLEIMSLHM